MSAFLVGLRMKLFLYIYLTILPNIMLLAQFAQSLHHTTPLLLYYEFIEGIKGSGDIEFIKGAIKIRATKV